MNDEFVAWFWALSAPLNPHVQPGERVVDAGHVERIAGVGIQSAAGRRDRRAERVLDRVALRVAGPRQRQAPCLNGRVGAALAVLERVVQLRAQPGRVLLPGGLARVEHASALVDEVAHLEQLLHRQPRRVARAPAELAGHDVVARVPDDGVVVAEHAERVGCRAGVGVDVIDVERDPVRRQRAV